MKVTVTKCELLGEEVHITLVDDSGGSQEIWLAPSDAPVVGRQYHLRLLTDVQDDLASAAA